MIEFISVFLILSLLYGIRLYISVGSKVYLPDILLTSLLGPSIIWMKIYGTVLSFLGIRVYYMMVFDEEKKDPAV